jgi:AraC family transcriptional regulator
MPAPLRPVPVVMGSPRFRTVDAGWFTATEAWFPPGAYLPPHIHDRTCFAVMLDGAFDVTFRAKAFECPPASVHTEPRGERHANRIGSGGAHVVVLQPDPAREALLRPLAPILDRATQVRHAGIAGLAAGVTREMDGGDSLSPLAIEGLGLEMLVAAARADERGAGARAPGWLRPAQEYLHAHRFEGIRLADVARVAGVHPAQLARVFRRYLRSSVAGYVRRLRLEWAAIELARTETPVAALAARAGFADQSHFTRAFRRWAGATPGRFRAAHARAPRGDAAT